MQDSARGHDPTSRTGVPPFLGSRAFSSADIEALHRLTPATLAMHLSNGAWQPADHLLLTALEVAQAIAQGSRNIIIGAPPRHGKSELLSYWTPIWALDRYPDWPIILTGYGADLVRSFSRRIRDTINYWTDESEGRNYLRCPLKRDSQNVDEWHTIAGGGLLAAGVGGPILGKGGKIFIVDDYLKNPKEAESPTFLEDIWQWFRGLVMTRLEPGAVVLIIASRWNRKDLVGRILEEEPDDWKIINFPALALDPEEHGPDLLGRQFDTALWPDRYSTAYLRKLRKRMGKYFFDAQYQQNPHAKTADSERTKAIPIEDIIPTSDFYRQCRSWDLAASGKDGDLMVGSRMMRDDERKVTVILHQKGLHPSPDRVKETVVQTALDDGPEVPVVIEQEPGSSGKTWIADLKNDPRLKKFMVIGIPSTGSKWIRAQPLITAAENGKLVLKRGDWNDPFMDEFCEFDGAKNGKDNRVDSVTLGYNYLNKALRHAGTWGRPVKESHNKHQERGKLIVGPVFGRDRG